VWRVVARVGRVYYHLRALVIPFAAIIAPEHAHSRVIFTVSISKRPKPQRILWFCQLAGETLLGGVDQSQVSDRYTLID
jgi:hypothetical protein